MKKESELKARGYALSKLFTHRYDAANHAASKRQQGYRAQVVEYSTQVPGLHDYAVWSRAPEAPNYLDLAKESLAPGRFYSMEEFADLGIPWNAVRALLEVGVLKFHRRNAYSLKEANQ